MAQAPVIAPKKSPEASGDKKEQVTPDPKKGSAPDPGADDPKKKTPSADDDKRGGGDDNKGGDDKGKPDPKLGDTAWREPIVALAGDNAERKTLLEGFATFDDMAAALERGASSGDDWRADMAGGDDALKKELERYNSPAEAGRALKEAKDRIRKGVAAMPAADATPEEWGKFSSEHLGRPEKVEDIKVEPVLADGDELTDDEAAITAAVLGAAHKSGKFGQVHNQDLAQIVVDLLVGGRKEMEGRTAAKKAAHEKDLRKVWKSDSEFTTNVGYANAAAAAFCSQAGVDPGALAALKLEDGTRLGDHALYAQAMAVAGRQIGEDPIIPDDDNAPGTTLADLEAALKGENAKRNSSKQVERNEYDSEPAKARRAALRAKIDRAKSARTK